MLLNGAAAHMSHGTDYLADIGSPGDTGGDPEAAGASAVIAGAHIVGGTLLPVLIAAVHPASLDIRMDAVVPVVAAAAAAAEELLQDESVRARA